MVVMKFFAWLRDIFINFNMLIMLPISQQQHMHTSWRQKHGDIITCPQSFTFIRSILKSITLFLNLWEEFGKECVGYFRHP
jgi:hypothetical protein